MLKLPRPKTVTLDSGVTLLYQRNPFSDTNAIGVWVMHGSRDESSSERGLSHLLEHMVFRGSRRRDALRIALDLEALGGQWDAYTTKESTSFSAKVLAGHFESLVDIYADLLLHPTFPPDAFALERRVVQEEIRSTKDSPEEFVQELFMATLFKGHPLSHPIAGYLSQIGAYRREDLIEFHRRVYAARNMVICYIGNLPFPKVSRIVDEQFRFARKGRRSDGRARIDRKARKAYRVRRNWAQTHVCAGTQTVPITDPLRYELTLLANILGGGVSSRLFQAMREERGLAYAVYAHSSFFRDAGQLVSYFSVDARNLKAAFDIFLREVEDLGAGNIEPAELESAKAQLKAAITFSAESVISRLFMLFHNHCYHGRHVPAEEMIAAIDRVSIDSIAEAAGRFLGRDAMTIASCGPLTL